MDGDRSPSSLLREAGKKAPDQLPAKPVLRHGCELCSSPLRYLCLLVLITHHAFDFFGGFPTLCFQSYGGSQLQLAGVFSIA